MIIVKIHGGLGNQMFQYALGRSIALRHGCAVKLDLSFYEQRNWKETPRTFQLSFFRTQLMPCSEKERRQFIVNPTIQKWNKRINRLNINFLSKYYQEKSCRFDENILTLKDNVYLEGYWQTPQYFEPFSAIIREDFTFREDLNDSNQALYERIVNAESVAVHIRRGDYLTNPMHNVFEITYLQKAIQIMVEKLGKNIQLFIFSDDLNWCKVNLNNINPELPEYYCEGGDTKEDLQLMSSCKHFIIANSSFSWWAAWLSGYQNKVVIAPKKWFNDVRKDTTDLLPKDWIQI